MTKGEFCNNLKLFEDRYLTNILYELYCAHDDLHEEIQALIDQAIENKKHDKYNDLLIAAHLPMYPDHYTLKDFDPICLDSAGKEIYEQMTNLSFLDSRSKPNLILYGPPGQGKEKVAIGLAAHFCSNRHSALYIDFHQLLKVISTHERLSDSNTTYEDLQKVECLIIHDFAGQNIYDPDLLDALDVLLQERIDKQTSRHNARWKPHLTYVDTCYPPKDWIKHFTADEMKVYSIINKLYGMGLTLHIDETSKPSKKGDKQ